MHGPKSTTKSLLSHELNQIGRSNTYIVLLCTIAMWLCCRRDKDPIVKGREIKKRQMVQDLSNCGCHLPCFPMLVGFFFGKQSVYHVKN
jgi:hypothetical protein